MQQINIFRLQEIASTQLLIRASIQRSWHDFELFTASPHNEEIYRVTYSIVRPPQDWLMPISMQFVQQSNDHIQKLFQVWKETHPLWLSRSQFVGTFRNDNDKEEKITPIHPRIMIDFGWLYVLMMREYEKRIPRGRQIMEVFLNRLQGFVSEQERGFDQAIKILA